MTDPTPLRGDWNYPTAIRFGAGRVVELPEACRALGMRNPLLVTDRGVAALPMVADAVASCRAAGLGCAVFGDVRPNPTGRDVAAGMEAFRAGRHDGVIAWGGGSGLDAGKAVALMVGQSRPLFDFEDREDGWTRVDPAGLAPVVAVPTTSGTGSEVGRASVITDEAAGEKKIIFHPRMMPGLVIADPALLLGLPPAVTAAVGMDALSHSLEAFCSPAFHPMAGGIALEAMRLLGEWLPRAVADGSDLAARAHTMAASSMGAVAFQKGLGAMHALAHPCSAAFDTHHGLTIAVVMPYVLSFNRAAIADRMTLLARVLDLPDPSFDAVLAWVLDLRARFGIPHRLGEIGIPAEAVPRLAAAAIRDPSCAGNPVPLTEPALAALYRAAFDGTLPVR